MIAWGRSIAACALLFRLAARADESEEREPRYDLAGELAWARATWPDDLKGLHFKSPAAKVFRWVRPGRTIVVYVHTSDDACKPVELSHYVDTEHEERGASDPADPPILNGKLNFKVRIEQGKKIRAFDLLWIGERLEKGDDWQDEIQDEHGRWQPHTSGGYGLEGTMYGVLSYADDRVARFGGEPMTIHAHCEGPFEWLPCTRGGERPCDRCERMGIVVTEGRGGLYGYRDVPHDGRPITCNEACPAYPESPLRARLGALQSHVRLWRMSTERRGSVPSLYRFREDCLREHPPRPAGTK